MLKMKPKFKKNFSPFESGPRSPKGYATSQCRRFVKHSDRLREMLGESPTGWQAKYRDGQ